ncbi:MAG: BON domain-containing protein [Sneathiella sp.]|uniref:BON domain-containing protein n=1 Tax=Sneathiella sp. TaxID=1964365 RepID=UPI003001EF5C
MKIVAFICFSLFAMSFLSGCAGVILGGAAATGVAVAEERSVGTIVDDASISTQIKGKIFEKSEPLFTDTATTVNDGIVLITGQVPTPDDRIELARIAWSVQGVKQVHNRTTVKGQGESPSFASDALITTKLKYQLLADTKIMNINYTVETVGKVVYLMGVAQDQAELDRVEAHAKEISGVRSIVSYVQLKSALYAKS